MGPPKGQLCFWGSANNKKSGIRKSCRRAAIEKKFNYWFYKIHLGLTFKGQKRDVRI